MGRRGGEAVREGLRWADIGGEMGMFFNDLGPLGWAMIFVMAYWKHIEWRPP